MVPNLTLLALWEVWLWWWYTLARRLIPEDSGKSEFSSFGYSETGIAGLLRYHPRCRKLSGVRR